MIGQRIMFDLRMQLVTHLHRLDLRFYDRNPVGRLMTRLTTDVDVLNELFTSGVVSVFGDVFTLIGIMAVLHLDGLAPGDCGVRGVAAHRRRSRIGSASTRANRIAPFERGSPASMPICRSALRAWRRCSCTGAKQRDFEAFDEIDRRHRDANVQSIFYYAVFYPAVELVGALAASLILWVGGARIIADGGDMLTLGSLVAFLQYSQRFFRPISDLSEKFNILQGAMASSERIFGLLDTPVEIGNSQLPTANSQLPGTKDQVPRTRRRTKTVDRGPGVIRFENVTLRLCRRRAGTEERLVRGPAG